MNYPGRPSTLFQLKIFLKLPTGTMKPLFPVFTCLICQGFLSRSIVSVPFQWPKPRWLADFWGFWICGYCFPQTFSVFVIVFSLCHQWKVFCLLFSAGFVYLFHLLWISRLILSGVFVLFHVWWNSLFGHYSLSSPGHSHVYGLTGCLLQALQPDSHVFFWVLTFIGTQAVTVPPPFMIFCYQF